MSPPTKTIGTQDLAITYVERIAVRAILYNQVTNKIALIHVAKGNYFKLPGGGIEGDEDHLKAVAREILEETGCKALVDEKSLLAQSEEWRNDLHQVSYCYVARLAEDIGRTELTDLEMSEGLSHSWVAVYSALESMREVQPTTELGQFIKERDAFFVEIFATQGY